MTFRQCEIHSKSQPLLQKTCFYYYFLLLYIFETLAMYAGVCLRVHTLAHVRGLKATLVIYFQKQIFAHLKGYIFHFNTPQVNLISDWVLNWPWALKFRHHWETGARVVRGIKCGVYKKGHTTEQCRVLKNHLEQLVKVGYLKEFVVRQGGGNIGQGLGSQSNTLPLPLGIIQVIFATSMV